LGVVVTKAASWMMAAASLGLAGLLGGCGMFGGRPQVVAGPPVVPFDAPAAQGCPWLEGEHFRPAVAVPGTVMAPPKPFVQGCAIVKFTVAADGHVSSTALRAAYPLDGGPVALAALQQMRFQPGRSADAVFLIRLSLRRDAAGRVTVTPDTRQRTLRFWEWS
jgi:hypothetical protein